MQRPLIQLSNVYKKFGFTAVMISHEVPGIFFLSQRIAMLDEGKIRFEGTPDEIQRCTDPVVQLFIQGLEKPRDALTGFSSFYTTPTSKMPAGLPPVWSGNCDLRIC
jgi:ABC-type transporter Mla maintaining outer membrane lipid asymmetry ATPase subunit MlaF